MKRLFIVLTLGVIFLLTSCGGGSSGPTLPGGDRNLAGLEGSWIVTWSFSGTLNASGDSIVIADSGVDVCIITTNTVEMDGELVTWSYDGKTLTIQENDIETFWDSDCGDMTLTAQSQMKVSLSQGSSYGNISGSAIVDGVSDFCGTMDGSIDYSGNFSK